MGSVSRWRTALVGLVATAVALGTGLPSVAANTGGSISGTITAPAGSSLVGINISVVEEDSYFYGHAMPQDDDGSFTVQGLRPGQYTVYVSDAFGNLVSEYYGDAFAVSDAELVSVGNGQTTGVDLELATGATIQGSVTGKGDSRLIVSAYDTADYPQYASYAEVQPDGSYALAGLAPGREYKLQFSMMVHSSLVIAPTWYGGGTSFTTAESILIDNPIETAESLPLAESGTIALNIEGKADVEMTCVFAYPATGRTELPVRARPQTGEPCGYSPDAVAMEIALGNTPELEFRGLPEGSYRLYLSEPFPPRGSNLRPLTRAGQWISGAILKSNAAVVTVQAGQTSEAPAVTYFPAKSFTDVPTGLLFHDEISWLASSGVTTGWTGPNGTNTYRPVTPIARDAMAAFVYRLAGSPDYDAPKESPFIDVSTESMYYKEIAWLESTGISAGWTNGNGDKAFRPLSPIARDAMAAFLYRFAGEPDTDPQTQSPFADISVEQEHFEAIAWLASTGISTGWTEPDGQKTYRALDPVNRDAMAAFMFRYAEMVNEQP
ncbi:carboxypeptidase regulatory-like domain-containing protein [Arthrobacter sp. CAN_C5]|uniref:carboxypeptidase regulatory-like domain-containing protein n=1 Tax=Arthrobacter sp. CAN_C5 TaxID=2760706 RepID=UPI001FDA3BC9|nr:carboxypeptidase regulatory-like domain-containing protein [Arthrobacter sp. CAN_C5]